MRFVIKAIFWFMVVLLFLPEDAIHKSDSKSAAPIDRSTTTSSVKTSDVIAQVSRLCTEQPGVCERAANALSTIELDTEKGARLALELLLRAADDESVPSEN
ncbi:MAG: DUF5330 domain-containing protein [Alphaproteobacteria bacterium]|nr:DUF5330 domain-containing protein [Alphaproteobacteria bacterium]